MARFSIDDADRLIAYNRQQLVQLAGKANGGDALMQRVMRQLELSLKCIERHRDERAAQHARTRGAAPSL